VLVADALQFFLDDGPRVLKSTREVAFQPSGSFLSEVVMIPVRPINNLSISLRRWHASAAAQVDEDPGLHRSARVRYAGPDEPRQEPVPPRKLTLRERLARLPDVKRPVPMNLRVRPFADTWRMGREARR
jgi:hypothetical protein